MNKVLHIKQKHTLTSRTHNVKFTHKEEKNMNINIVEANVDYKLIGKRIKEARKKIGWSQEMLAETIDVAVAYISRIERGSTSINLRRLAQISIALSTPIEKLITGINPESKSYLHQEFQALLAKCTPDKQQLIYNIAKIVAGIKFV